MKNSTKAGLIAGSLFFVLVISLTLMSNTSTVQTELEFDRIENEIYTPNDILYLETRTTNTVIKFESSNNVLVVPNNRLISVLSYLCEPSYTDNYNNSNEYTSRLLFMAKMYGSRAIYIARD